ncbi:hypothetical protein [Thalassospira sp. TSL5-1]|uniref:hypothetical protein n=1 Tax=Thalassospira sp. TSL5-1 TaxID=1544451 RepID=UPI00093ED1A0|nr:hypothetical protein [Thalassospira sp. TSL5-1]OKH89284.1 hypothetical protein LF95_04535 [Thalassospira sp. TSL5-1]
MAYIFTEADDPTQIAERQWGQADPIMFTTFTSCIGIMGIKDDQVIGVHLALMGTADELVTNANIDQAIALLDGAANPVIIGQIEIWEDAVPAVYQHLVSTLHPVAIYPRDDGTYGGRNNQGNVQPLEAP